MTTLSDADIGDEMGLGRLIRNGDAQQLAGACYELRLGNVYYDLTESDLPIFVGPGQDILIKPGHRVVLITHEELEVPTDVLARIVSKGSPAQHLLMMCAHNELPKLALETANSPKHQRSPAISRSINDIRRRNTIAKCGYPNHSLMNRFGARRRDETRRKTGIDFLRREHS